MTAKSVFGKVCVPLVYALGGQYRFGEAVLVLDTNRERRILFFHYWMTMLTMIATYTGDWKCMSVVSAEEGPSAFQR